MFSPFQYVSGFLAIALGASLYFIDIQADKIVQLRTDIKVQNKAIQDLGDEYAENLTEYHNKKDKVTTKYVKSYITKEVIKYKDNNNTKESCENTNIIFDNIRYIGL